MCLNYYYEANSQIYIYLTIVHRLCRQMRDNLNCKGDFYFFKYICVPIHPLQYILTKGVCSKTDYNLITSVEEKVIYGKM